MGGADEKKNDEIPTDVDKDINSNDALGSDKNKFCLLKFLPGLTRSTEEITIFGMTVVDHSSSIGEPGTDADDEVISGDVGNSDKEDASMQSAT
ncbi:hypothetical protein HOY82DRAFT_633709 [Tuber indicum]|nr:hypothetical protein HOY82DRAFT_633709 [Tuber indicum]